MKDNNLAKYLSIFIALVALVGAILFIRVFMEDPDAIENDALIQASVVNPIVFLFGGITIRSCCNRNSAIVMEYDKESSKS